jgi:hypothetical protein
MLSKTVSNSIPNDKKFCECGCGILINKINTHGVIARFVSGHNLISKKSLDIHLTDSGWKTGIHKDSYGYIHILARDHHFADSRGYVKEHRLIMEKHLNACLLPWAIVHHINHVKYDNRIENLDIVNKSKHNLIHKPNQKDMSGRFCYNCNSDKTSMMKDGCLVWHRHPITKQQWLCTLCYDSIRRKIKREKRIKN